MKQFTLLICCLSLVIIGMAMGWILTYKPEKECDQVCNEKSLKAATATIRPFSYPDGAPYPNPDRKWMEIYTKDHTLTMIDVSVDTDSKDTIRLWLPSFLETEFPSDWEITIRRKNSGGVVIVPGIGVEIRTKTSELFVEDISKLKNVGRDVWTLTDI